MNTQDKILKDIENISEKLLKILIHERQGKYCLLKPQALEALTMVSTNITDAIIRKKAFDTNHPSFYNALCAFNIAAQNLNEIFAEIHTPSFIQLTDDQTKKVTTHFLEDKPGNPIVEINGKKIKVSKEMVHFKKEDVDVLAERLKQENNNKEDK